MSREDEARLAGRLMAGDPSAFRELVAAYQRKVYGLAYEMTRNHADAEDISQVTFMKVHRSIGTVKPGLGLRTWIYQIAHNSAIDHIRKRSFFPAAARPSPGSATMFDDPVDPSAGPGQEAEAAGLRRRIDEALDGFSERERAVFILRHYHDLKLTEIAEALHISLGTAKSYLFRSLRKLQKALGDFEPRPDQGGRS